MSKSMISYKYNLWKKGCCTLLALPFVFLPAWQTEGKLRKRQPSNEKAFEGICIEEVTSDRMGNRTTMRIRVFTDAPPGKTWAVHQNLQGWSRFTKLISRVVPLETKGSETRYSFYVSPPWPINDFDAVIRVEKRPEERQIFWKAGRAEKTGKEGIISVQESYGGTRITYEICGTAESAFPNWVMKIGVNLILPSVLNNLYHEIRERG